MKGPEKGPRRIRSTCRPGRLAHRDAVAERVYRARTRTGEYTMRFVYPRFQAVTWLTRN